MTIDKRERERMAEEGGGDGGEWSGGEAVATTTTTMLMRAETSIYTTNDTTLNPSSPLLPPHLPCPPIPPTCYSPYDTRRQYGSSWSGRLSQHQLNHPGLL